MMRCLSCVSVAAALAIAGCGSHPYKHLQAIPAAPSLLGYKPELSRALYRCVADGQFLFKKFHLSGVLLFKAMGDGSTRAVFQNEMGFAFFDFKWDKNDSFSVVSIMDRLNKPAVIKTLQRDMELVLMKGLSPGGELHYLKEGDTLSRFPLGKGAAWYRLHDGSLTLIDYVGKSPVTTIDLPGATAKGDLPDTIHIRHHKAHFTIDLTRLSSDPNE
jgi:hypothetical protein